MNIIYIPSSISWKFYWGIEIYTSILYTFLFAGQSLFKLKRFLSNNPNAFKLYDSYLVKKRFILQNNPSSQAESEIQS